MFTGNKIKEFFKLLDEGVNMEEAAQQIGLSVSTARTQYSKWKKNKPTVAQEEPEEVEEDIEVTPEE